jgi:hypothetical protein
LLVEEEELIKEQLKFENDFSVEENEKFKQALRELGVNLDESQ